MTGMSSRCLVTCGDGDKWMVMVVMANDPVEWLFWPVMEWEYLLELYALSNAARFWCRMTTRRSTLSTEAENIDPKSPTAAEFTWDFICTS